MAEERASDCEEKLESSVAHASLDVAAKTTMPATEGVARPDPERSTDDEEGWTP